MARPRTRKTTYGASYPRYPLGRTQYVTTDRRGNRQVTNVNGVFVAVGQGLLGMGVALLGMFVLAVLVILCVVALGGLATRNKSAKHLPLAWLALWGGLIKGWFSRL